MERVILLTLALTGSTLALPNLPGSEIVGQGYNILNANPDAVGLGQNPSEDGNDKDPGFTGKRILHLSYDRNKEDLFGSKKERFSLPDQISYSGSSLGCGPTQHMLYKDLNSYRQSLLKRYHTNGLEDFQQTAFAFGMGSEPSDLTVYSQETTPCGTGEASYDLENPDKEVHQLDADFVNDICMLIDAGVHAYYDVIDKYGTHMVQKVGLGYVTSKRQYVPMDVFLEATDSLPESAYSYTLGVPTSRLSVSAADLKSYTHQLFGSGGQTWTIGSIDDPQPGYYQLLRLSSIIDANSNLWKKVCETKTACCEGMRTIRDEMDVALRGYADHKNVKAAEDEYIKVEWPQGQYGLPQPELGCPRESDFTWASGTVIQYTSGLWREHNEISSSNHFPVSSVKDQSVKQKFCMKDAEDKGLFHWETGSYCIFQKGACPRGFSSGSLFFDDDNSGNLMMGSVPDGTFADSSTEIEYCCRNDGSPLDPILLPSRESFYLLRRGGSCQKVHNMYESTESISFSRPYWWYAATNLASGATPDVLITDEHLKVYYCYYTRKSTTTLYFALETQ